MAGVGIAVIVFFALPLFRRNFFEVFYIIHTVMYTFLVVMVVIHAIGVSDISDSSPSPTVFFFFFFFF